MPPQAERAAQKVIQLGESVGGVSLESQLGAPAAQPPRLLGPRRSAQHPSHSVEGQLKAMTQTKITAITSSTETKEGSHPLSDKYNTGYGPYGEPTDGERIEMFVMRAEPLSVDGSQGF